MPASAHAPPTFHISLNVTDVARSAAFYRKFLDCEPATQTPDYAKFELQEPPLVLSLIPGRPAAAGNLNHIGFRLSSAEALLQTQMRLETAGIATQREDGVACCQSRQTKFWVSDPDRILWEIYIFHEEDGPHEAAPPLPPASTPPAAPAKIIWQHRLPDPFPARIPYPDNSLHEVILEGVANMEPASVSLESVFAEAYRALRPGGEVRLHGLAGDKASLPLVARLPGPAAVVAYVPQESEPLQAMLRAGFVRVHFEKLSPAPNFIVDNVQMREILLAGLKPGHRPSRQTHQAIYLGPLAQVVDDFGNIFPRGQRVSLNVHDWQLLAHRPGAEQFLLLPLA